MTSAVPGVDIRTLSYEMADILGETSGHGLQQSHQVDPGVAASALEDWLPAAAHIMPVAASTGQEVDHIPAPTSEGGLDLETFSSQIGGHFWNFLDLLYRISCTS